MPRNKRAAHPQVNLYEKICERAARSLAEMESRAPIEPEVYPREALYAHDRAIITACEAGEPLRIARWQIPRDMPIRDTADSFLVHPDGRIVIDD